MLSRTLRLWLTVSDLEQALAQAKNVLKYRRVCIFDPYVRMSTCRVHYRDPARPDDAFCEEVPYLEWFGFDALAKLVEALEKGTNNE